MYYHCAIEVCLELRLHNFTYLELLFLNAHHIFKLLIKYSHISNFVASFFKYAVVHILLRKKP